MTDAVPFDTLQFTKNLAGSGLPRDQAETLVEQIALICRNLATKSDLTAEIGKLRLEVRGEIQKVRAQLVIWMVGLLFAQTGIVVALIVGLPRLLQ